MIPARRTKPIFGKLYATPSSILYGHDWSQRRSNGLGRAPPVHCGSSPDDKSLALGLWSRRWTASARREYLGAGEMESRLAVIRPRKHTGRPLGTADSFRIWRRRRSGALRFKREVHTKQSPQIEDKVSLRSMVSILCFQGRSTGQVATWQSICSRDSVRARVAYESFVTLWKSADPEIPILKQPDHEYAQLGRGLDN